MASIPPNPNATIDLVTQDSAIALDRPDVSVLAVKPISTIEIVKPIAEVLVNHGD